jgi:hypothetical protein
MTITKQRICRPCRTYHHNLCVGGKCKCECSRPYVTSRCAAGTCGNRVTPPEQVCAMHGGTDHTLNRYANPVTYIGNPWAASAPDCPQGHHARHVYRWSYDDTDPWPWFCPTCKQRFAP